ncbi:thymidine kinase [Chlorella sorokiniana]|uniref:thymidine kinase n=1 Tax=Chlorella sorokiniana TaxID=3076 RepID=A0A2P6TIV7_CHLSO|nr:thymidine kinase [Chlorella sorokiniana]|eukprot:PRW39184.1 thymidine kinase [Chlorella sorokiniana]
MLPRALCTSGAGCSSLRAAAASRSRLHKTLATPVRRLLGLGSGSSAWAGGSDRLGVAAAAAQQRRPIASALEALAEADSTPEALQPPPSAQPQHPGSYLHLAAQPRPLTVEHPHPGIEIFMGPMFAGKTTALLRRVAELEARGFSVAVVKSSKDDRYCNASVVTHNGLKRPCFAAPTLRAFREAAGADYPSFHVIAVDEAQFFPDLHDFCSHAADHEHKRVVLAGLDGDFQRKRFGQVLDLLPMADSVVKLTAHCKFCKQEHKQVPALFSLRIAADSRQELVGGADTYAPVCRRHYVQLSQLRQPDEQPDSSGSSGGTA